MAGNGFVRVPGAIPDTAGETVRQDYTNGAALVSDAGQVPSSYSGVVVLSTAAASEALASGVRSVVVTNLDPTAANYAILAFGINQADAEANLATGGWTVRANSEKQKAVPASAGAIAYKSAAGTPSIELTWG